MTDRDFLFINLGVSTLTPDDHVGQTAMMTGGGAIPALIGAAIGHYVASLARDRLNRLNKSLEVADEDVLRQFAEEDPDSFVVPFCEVKDVGIKRKSLWGSMVCQHLVAYLSLTRIGTGPMTVALIAPNEMVTVAEEMKRVFGEVPCDLSWRAF